MLRIALFALVGLAAAAPCSVKCCAGTFGADQKTCAVTKGALSGRFPLTVAHITDSDHQRHRCFKDLTHVNKCDCLCKNEGDEFETTSDGALFDSSTGATASAFKLDGTATISGVSLEVARSEAFLGKFKAALASKLDVAVASIGIASVSAAGGRRLLSAASSIDIEYVVYAKDSETMHKIVKKTVTSFTVGDASASVETREKFHVGTKGGRCAKDQVINTKEQCIAALAYVGNAAKGIHWQGATTIIPKGCSLKHTVWHGNPHFNAYSADEKTKLRKDMTPICVGPEKYHVGVEGGRCAAGKDILTKTDCVKALAYISNPVLAIHWEGSTRGIPNGCSLKHTVWHGNPHWNKATNSVKGRGDMTPICKGAGSPATGITNQPTSAPTTYPTSAPTPAPVVIREILRSGETTVKEIKASGHGQSSQYSNWVASRGNDGSTGTMQHTAGGRGETNPWYYSKLSQAGEVHQVKIFGRTGGCASRLFSGSGCTSSNPSGNYNNAATQGATIRVSNSPCSGDNCPGTICGRITKSTGSAQAYTINCPPGTTGQYVSILLPGNNRMLHIREMDVMRFADTTKLVATHSSQYSSWDASRGMDDNESTMQHTVGGRGEKSPWFQIALNSRTYVSSVAIRARTGGCASRLFSGSGCTSSNPSGNYNNAATQGATIRVSDSPCSGDNCPGTICGRITKSTGSAQAYAITCPKGTQGKYVSIQLPGNNRMLHIKEMDIFEIESGF